MDPPQLIQPDQYTVCCGPCGAVCGEDCDSCSTVGNELTVAISGIASTGCLLYLSTSTMLIDPTNLNGIFTVAKYADYEWQNLTIPSGGSIHVYNNTGCSGSPAGGGSLVAFELNVLCDQAGDVLTFHVTLFVQWDFTLYGIGSGEFVQETWTGSGAFNAAITLSPGADPSSYPPPDLVSAGSVTITA